MEGTLLFQNLQFLANVDYFDSGSFTMAYVMALQQGWPTDDLKFQGTLTSDLCGQ